MAMHKTPADIQKKLVLAVQDKWDSLTPLSKNEWICWITSARKEETREKRIERAKTDLLKGKRRPCCWPGCSHR